MRRGYRTLQGSQLVTSQASFGLAGFAAPAEGPAARAGDGGQVGEPAAAFVGLDMAGPGDNGVPEGFELDLLSVDGPDGAIG